MDAKPYKIPHPFRKLNKKLIDTLVSDIKKGSTHRLAAESNGITLRIFEIWRNQGDIDIEHEVDTLPAYLVRSLSKVKKIEVQTARKLIAENEKGHKGAEWTLERAYWRDFGSSVPLQELAQEIAEFKMQLKGVHENVEIDSESEAESA